MTLKPMTIDMVNIAPLLASQESGSAMDEDLYFQQLEWLREEMHTAMLSISSNSLQVLESSLWKQEVLCVSLKHLVQSMQGSMLGGNAMVRVQSATMALSKLNETYADLVSQARSSSDLLYGLCLSYQQATHRGAHADLGNHCSLEA